jgi:hypothetical protein
VYLYCRDLCNFLIGLASLCSEELVYSYFQVIVVDCVMSVFQDHSLWIGTSLTKILYEIYTEGQRNAYRSHYRPNGHNRMSTGTFPLDLGSLVLCRCKFFIDHRTELGQSLAFLCT